MGINLERSTAYFVVRTRAIRQECAMSPFRNKRKLQKLKLGRTSRSRSCTLLRATLPTYQSMWAIIPQLLSLCLVTHRLPGHNSHPRHHYSRPILEASQKGAIILSSNAKLGRNPKLAQSIVLCQNRSSFIDKYPTSVAVFAFSVISYLRSFFLISVFCRFQFLVIASPLL